MIFIMDRLHFKSNDTILLFKCNQWRTAMGYRRYHGSCHCQAVRYEAEFDLSAGSNRCNCSLCSKARAWFLFVRGDKFTLLAGEDMLSSYQWVPPGRTESGLTYRFCSRCGIRLYATGDHPQFGGRFYALHVPTLNNVDWEDLV